MPAFAVTEPHQLPAVLITKLHVRCVISFVQKSSIVTPVTTSLLLVIEVTLV